MADVTVLDVKGGFASAVSTQLPAFAVDPIAGDLIVVCVAIFNRAGATFTVTDSVGNTYTRIGAILDNAGIPGSSAMFYAQNITGGSTFRVTLTNSASRGHALVAWLIRGASVNAFNGDNNATVGNSTQPTAGLSTLTPAVGSIFIAMTYFGAGGSTVTDPVGWNTVGSNGFTAGMKAAASQNGYSSPQFADVWSIYKISGTTENPQWTVSGGAVAWGAHVASFAPASSPSPTANDGGDDMHGYYDRQREFFGTISGNRHVAAADTGTIALVPAVPKHTLYIQLIHIAVTTLAASELWTFQDGAGTPLPLAPVSAAAIANLTIDFGAQGVPCTEGTAFNLLINGATGAVGWVTWEGYKKLTLGAAA